MLYKEKDLVLQGKIYSGGSGTDFAFQRYEPSIGSGGNGSVYIILLRNDPERSAVAKFFRCDQRDARKTEKRYKRFRREVDFLQRAGTMDGIVPMIAASCPESTPKSDDEAWYIMPEATPYQIRSRRDIITVIDEMLRLAGIIQELHEMGIVHRDIKPENILLHDEKVCLTDFGLLWDNSNTERLTELGERIGPYRIMPPEFEETDPRSDTDYTASDVYLFAKVLWMCLKRDEQGFRGQYNRGEQQIYLQDDDYKAVTLEPLHQLLYTATYDDLNNRIGLKECIRLLRLQRDILIRPSAPELQDLISSLRFDEALQSTAASTEPDQMTYEDQGTIVKWLRKMTRFAHVSIGTIGREQQSFDKMRFQTPGEQGFELNCNINGQRRIYHFEVEKVVYHIADELLTAHLKNFDQKPAEWISFGKSLTVQGMQNKHIYLGVNETIYIRKRQS